jgi:hypothetical protein
MNMKDRMIERASGMDLPHTHSTYVPELTDEFMDGNLVVIRDSWFDLTPGDGRGAARKFIEQSDREWMQIMNDRLASWGIE